MTTDAGITIRDARPEDAEDLTAIAFAAKRHWGYPEDWIELWSGGLTIRDQDILEHTFFVAEHCSVSVGVCALELARNQVEMTHLWVRPQHMGRGVGRRLFDHAVAFLRARRIGRLVIVSDPHAEEFYLKRGARRIGESPSTPEGRLLPELEYTIHRDSISEA